MFYIYTPYVAPSGKRVSHSKIIIYEVVPTTTNNTLADVIRKFELTRKGWKTSKDSGRVYFNSRLICSLDYAATCSLTSNFQKLYFNSFDDAYAAKCILINRIPEVYLNMISTLTTKMNSLKSATPDIRYMSDAVPELFI